MKSAYRNLRMKQLASTLSGLDNLARTPRPRGGWLRAIREALGTPQSKIAKTLRVKQQSIASFEKAEATDRITIANLRRVADALGCELVYAIVPKSGSIQDLVEQEARSEATKRVLSVEHTMALEDQAPGGVNELIDKEIKRNSTES
jgi:predicted DNA-binding mobile mystery protein A